jgi:hypothetical protein
MARAWGDGPSVKYGKSICLAKIAVGRMERTLSVLGNCGNNASSVGVKHVAAARAGNVSYV